MKIFQIFNNLCYNDVTNRFPTVESTVGFFPPDVLFIEAPDYVFENWGYDATKTGDERFIKPTPPDGWTYDENTGTFYREADLAAERIAELKQKLADTDYVVIKIAEGSATEEEYADVIEQRRAWRQEINELEEKLNAQAGE